MSGKVITRRKYTLLIRKLTITNDLLFVTTSHNSGEQRRVESTSECILNQQFQIVTYDDGHPNNNNSAELHILSNIDAHDVEIGTLQFDLKNQKIMKPLSKEFFSKQLLNKKGYIQYKFIGCQTKSVSQKQLLEHTKIKNQLIIQINQNKVDRQQFESLMLLISQKDEIIAKMQSEISKLIKQTKKLNKSLSKQKAHAAQQIQKSINLNVKFNPSGVSLQKQAKNSEWQRERSQYQYQIQKLSRRIRDFESRQRQYRDQIQSMRKKMQSDIKDNQRKISDLRQQIQDRYEKQVVRSKRYKTEQKQSENDLQVQRERKNKFIQEQLAEHLKKIEVQKSREIKRDIDQELKVQLEIQNDRQRQRARERQRDRQKDKDKSRQKSRSFLRQSSAEHRQILKQINQLEDEKNVLKQRLYAKDEELHSIVIKLERAQKQILKLEDQNIELRKTKSSLLRQVEGIAFKNEPQKMKNSMERQPIEEYEKMIINQRQQIVDQKLRAEIEELKMKIKRDQKQYKQKLQVKQMQIMKLQLSQRSANRQKEVYSSRLHEIMDNVEGDRKNFLQAIQNSHKYESLQTRTKQLQISNNQLQTNNHKLNRQKAEIQNAMKKLKSKLDERQGEWVRLKSVQAQHDYYKTQCQKFEKAYKKFEKQYESIKEYCQNLQHIVGKKPRKTFDEEVNTQREERYKNQVRTRLQALLQEVRDMENKFYLEQIQIWLTQRTNVVQFYAKKFEEDKQRIMEMENINEQSRKNLLEEKQKQINQLKQQQLGDIDRKVAKLKLLVKSEEHKLVNAMVDKASFQQIVNELAQKIERLRTEQQKRKKQITQIKEKSSKLENELKEKNSKIFKLQNDQQKKSLSLLDDRQSRLEETKRSFFDEYKKNKESMISKPFEDMRKQVADLQAEKRKADSEMNAMKFTFQKEKVQLSDKIRTKQREIKKLEHDAANSEKNASKFQIQIQGLRKNREDLEVVIRKLREQLKDVSKTLQMKQRQCSEVLNEVKRMEKNLIAYQDAQKKMFEDVKKMKQKLQSKQLELESVMEQRNKKSKQIDAERVQQIMRLEQKQKQLQQKLQQQITQNLSLKSHTQKLSQQLTNYQVKLQQKQQEYEVLDQTFTIYKTQTIQKLQQYVEQNNILQTNLLQIAQEIKNKQTQSNQLLIKLSYSEKRQDVLNNIKGQLEEENRGLKAVIAKVEQDRNQIGEKFKEQVEVYEGLKGKIQDYLGENARLAALCKENERELREMENKFHEVEKQLIRVQGEKKNVETQMFYIKQSLEQKVSKLETAVMEKQLEIQKLQKQKNSRVSYEDRDRGRKSSEGINLEPSSPLLQRRMLNTSIQKSSSLIQNSKSSKQINSNGLMRKNSNRESQYEDSEQKYFSREDMGINVKKPTELQTNEQPKLPIPSKKQKDSRQNSKIDIDLNEVDDDFSKSAKIELFDKKNQFPNTQLKQVIELKRQATLEREEEQEEIRQQQLEKQRQQGFQQFEQGYEAKILEMQQIIEALTNQRDQLAEQLQLVKQTMQKDQVNAETSNFGQLGFKGNKSILNNSFQPQMIKKSDMSRNISQRSANEIKIDIAQKANANNYNNSSNKKIQELEHQIQELNSKVINYQLALSQNQQEINKLTSKLEAEEEGRQKLIVELQDTMKKLEQECGSNKQLRLHVQALEKCIVEKVAEKEMQLEEVVLESMKKDQTINETLKIIEKMNTELAEKQNVSQSLYSQISTLNSNLSSTSSILSSHKSQYRKYEEEAELQILRLKEKVDQLKLQIDNKNSDINELGERYLDLQTEIQHLKAEIQKKDGLVLHERAKIKEIISRRQQDLAQLRKFEQIKGSLNERVSQSDMKLAARNEQLKQLTKQTAIAYKKYEIQLETQKEQHSISRRKLKQREQHLTNLKLELANYNEKCHQLQKQKNHYSNQLTKLQKQISEIMSSYQQQLDSLDKNNKSLQAQVQSQQEYIHESTLKIQATNKDLSRKNRQIKELSYRIDDKDKQIQIMKDKHRNQIGDLVAKLEIKNDLFQKIKVQLERQTEHYFMKECQFISDRDNRDRLEKEYLAKLAGYEQVLKQLQDEFKQVADRPSSEQWEQVCFENQLYKNRIEQLEQKICESTSKTEQKILMQYRSYRYQKQKQIQDLHIEMQKYSSKFHNLEQNIYVLKKDNDSMKSQLRTIMQQKMRLIKANKEYEQDIRQLKEEVTFYKGKRVQQLNKLLNQTYD